MMGVPTYYSRLLSKDNFNKSTCKNIRLFISGSAPLTDNVFLEFKKRTDHNILERYGMSETGMITSNPLNGDRIAGTVGFALPDIDIRVSDETGQILPPDSRGIVEVKGQMFSVDIGDWKRKLKKSSDWMAFL